MSDFGEKIRKVRGLISREAFAQKIGVSRSSVYRFEKKGDMPSMEVIEEIRKQFNVDMAWLLGYEEGPDDESVYVAGKREEKVIEGARFRIQHVTPESIIETADQRRGEVRDSGVDAFGKASSSLREIYDKADPVIRIALEANLEAFKLASKMISDYRMMEDRVSNLEVKVAELERLIEEIRRIIIKHSPPPEIAERREDWMLLKSLLNLNDGAHPRPERIAP